jgi:hypothetical protein
MPETKRIRLVVIDGEPACSYGARADDKGHEAFSETARATARGSGGRVDTMLSTGHPSQRGTDERRRGRGCYGFRSGR